MDDSKKLEQQNKLIKLIYYDIDGYGSIKNTYDKAKLIDPTIEYDLVKNWHAKNIIKQYNKFKGITPRF